jgi:MFS family permease
MPLLNVWWFAVIIMILLGIAFSLVPSAMWPSVPKIIPMKQLGSAYAIIFYIQNIGFLFVPKAISAIKTASNDNYTAMMLFFAGLGVVALLISIGVKILDKKKNYGLQIPNIK